MRQRSPRHAARASGDLFAEAEAAPAFAPPDPDRRIFVGTSGWSFRDWVGPFYPPGTTSGDFLPVYAREFETVEVNSTYYGLPHPRVFEQIERKTPPHFRFVVKLNREHTHDRGHDTAVDRQLLAVIEPLKAAGKYDGLLAQFPGSFHDSSVARQYLGELRERFAGEPLFVEFRHDSWTAPDVPALLREHALGFVAVDEPALRGLMPPIAPVTADDAYVRFHGRNAANWWGGGGGDRYDWEYSRAELSEWLDRIAKLAEQARRTYLFFNNCHAGQAARSAKLMQELLRQQRLPA